MSKATPPGLLSLGFQTISLSNNTAVGLNSTCAKARVLIFSVETQNVRIRSDGTDPTLTTGVLLNSGESYMLEMLPAASLKFQRSTGTAKVSVQALKYVGDQ